MDNKMAFMNDSSLEMLEFPKIVEMLADYTSFSASRDLALNLIPSSDIEAVSLWLKQSAEARRLIAMRPEFSVGNTNDIRENIAVAAKGKILEPKTLLTIRETLTAARNVRNNLSKLSAELPALWDIAQGIVVHRNLEDEINRCITENGEISDNASAKLANLRQQVKDSRQKLLDRLGAMIKSKSREKLIQEPFITERDGRYVIPVKAEFRKDVKGIVHDISNTGATVFVEPWTTVELGNDLRQYIIEEQRELELILGTLSGQIGVSENEISENVVLLAEIDLALAKARFAERMKATEPNISVCQSDFNGVYRGDGILKLVKARHPLLKEKAVPLDVEIGNEFSVLVITGPNAGGKTVALKTIGLLSLMTQAGIPIPASEESCIPLFDGVFADIGDQQSIEQTLSTFSWHVNNIVDIIRSSTQRSLVLLDELGISTDPNEGTALAKAILLYFLGRGTMSVITTHYSDLKAFAHATPGIRNASLDFNPVTFAPTYHLTVGIPGGSNALSIALRLGLLNEIVDSAKSMMSKESHEIEKLMADLLNEKQRYEALRDEVEKESIEIENLKNELEKEGQRLKEQERQLLQETRDMLLENAAELQRAIRQAETELRKERKRESIERSKKVIDSIYKQLEHPDFHPVSGPIKESDMGNFSPGDMVRIADKNLEGVVLSLLDGGKQLEVQIGNTKLQVGIEGVEKLGSSAEELQQRFPMLSKSRVGKPTSLELDLRGKRADAVAAKLDKYLNDAFLSSLSRVRIIHGYATGTVRQIVRETLESHPLVKSFSPGDKEEGGDGVTIAYL